MSFEAQVLSNVSGRLCQITAGRDQLNLGGLCELIVIYHKGFDDIPFLNIPFNTNKKAEFSGDITLSTDVDAFSIKFSPETCDYKEVSGEDDHGVYYDQTLMLAIPKDRPEITWLKYKMSRDRYVFFYRDANGLTKMIGNSGNGLRVKMDLNTQKTFAGFNGHTMIARRRSLTPAPFWNIPVTDNILDHFI